jgi:hypothetical protein
MRETIIKDTSSFKGITNNGGDVDSGVWGVYHIWFDRF